MTNADSAIAVVAVVGGRVDHRRQLVSRLSRNRQRPTVIDADDGTAHHDADGWTLADGRRAHLVIRMRAGSATSYLGVASHDQPDEFTCGPQGLVSGGMGADRVFGYLVEVVELFITSGGCGMAVRAPIQTAWLVTGASSRRRTRRRLRHIDPDDYVIRGAEALDDDVIDGDAVLTYQGVSIHSRVRVLGYLDPLDGRYHWSGTAYAPQVRQWKQEDRATTLTVSAGDTVVDARIAEVTPWGTVRLTGVGEFPELGVPAR